MNKIPLKLSLKRVEGRRGKDSSDIDAAEIKKKKQQVISKDDNTCCCCGFRSEKYQEVYFKNGDTQDFSVDNAKTVCIFCHQCFNIDSVNVMRSGVLLWLPEIEQADLHHIARAIYVARISQGPIADAARRSLDSLMQRREVVKSRIGTDDPYILSMVMKDYLTNAQYERCEEKIDGVRLFPLDRRIIKEADLEFNQFPQILAFWRSKAGPFGGKPPQKWFDVYHTISS